MLLRNAKHTNILYIYYNIIFLHERIQFSYPKVLSFNTLAFFHKLHSHNFVIKIYMFGNVKLDN